MDYKNLFEKFNEGGKLLLPDDTVSFNAIPWSKHPTFEGVELKHIITSEKTDGQFSFHLVRIAPNKKIGNHSRYATFTLADLILFTDVFYFDETHLILPFKSIIICSRSGFLILISIIFVCFINTSNSSDAAMYFEL